MSRLRSRGGALGVVVLVLVVAAWPAAAQDFKGFEVNRFHPASSLRTGYFTVESGQSIPGGGWEVGLVLQYADDPFVVTEDGRRVFSVISSQLVGHLTGAYAPIDNLQFSLDVPTFLVQSSSAPPDVLGGAGALEGAGLGDIRINAKWTFVHQRRGGRPGIDAALLANFWLPTGDPDALQGESFRVEPRLAADLVNASGTGLALNLGFLIRETQTLSQLDVGNQVTYGLGIRVGILSEMGATGQPMLLGLVEFAGSVAVGAEGGGKEDSPGELLLGLRYRWNDLYLTGGGGFGLIEGAGAPDYRLLLGINYSAGSELSDRDGDGIDDLDDACPDDAEDRDGFEDSDGCPDTDNDADGLADIDDACPDEAEDLDGFEDGDGCPDTDNDADGLADVDDGCPNVAEDIDGFEDDDGCPDPDDDADGVADVIDRCPHEPEDIDGFEDDDGCPEEGPAIATVERIEITSQIQFDYDRATLRPESASILNGVSQVIVDHPEILVLRIEGHSSTEGTSAHNLDLSQRRAEAVMEALVERGIARERLRAQGFGESRPIEADETAAGAAERNRRVEFHIEERQQ